MSLFAIADLHLPLGIDKPMDIFGERWIGYVDKLYENWTNNISDNDYIVIAGDVSWATYIEQAVKDFDFLNSLPGKKIVLKGNHDYWWTTTNKLNNFISQQGYKDIYFLNNNSYEHDNISICGTRGWVFDGSTDDNKIFSREVQRLELSLKSAKYNDIIVFTHYPPLTNQKPENDFVDLLKKYNVKQCIYGHLHNASCEKAVQGNVEGIEYKLVSSDYLDFFPYKIL